MMLASNRVRVLVSTQPFDFQKGHDGLVSIVSSVLRKDPFTGTVFVFRSRKADNEREGAGLSAAGWCRCGLALTRCPAAVSGLLFRCVQATGRGTTERHRG